MSFDRKSMKGGEKRKEKRVKNSTNTFIEKTASPFLLSLSLSF